AFTLDTTGPALTAGLAHDTGTVGDGITSDLTLTGTGEAGMDIYIGGAAVATVGADGHWTVPYFAPPGDRVIEVMQADRAGNQTLVTLPVTFTQTRPPLTLTGGGDTINPVATGRTFAGATVTIELTAIGSGLPSVISTITANEKGAFSYTLPSDGTWTLSATVTDAASGLTETQGTYVVLDRQADAGGDFAIDATIVNVPGTTNTRVDFVIVGLDPQHIDNAGHVTGGFAVRFTDVNGTSVTSRWGSLSGVEYLNGL